MSTHNARQTDRAPFFTEIDVLSAGTPTPRRLWGADVSESGVFLQTTHPYRVGDRVALRFDVDEHEVHVRAAEVMWVRPFEPISVDGRLPGIGLRFITVDPPARAALRRLVRQAAGEHRPGDTTLPDATCQAIGEQPAPAASLPPVTRSMLMRAGAPEIERTEEMLAMSIPPFTDPPRADQRQASIDAVLAPPLFAAPLFDAQPGRFSLPPDEPLLDAEARVFQTPAAVTLGPKRASKPPASPAHSSGDDPFAGWTFKKAPDTELAEEQGAPPEGLGLSFDDERPDALLGGTEADGDSGPTELAAPAALSHDHEPEPCLSARRLDAGSALSALPVAHERRRRGDWASTKVMPLAAALLCSGALVGVGVGVVSKRVERQPARIVAANAPPVAAAPSAIAPSEQLAEPPPMAALAPQPVRPVAEMERALAPVDVIAGARATVTPARSTPRPAPQAAAPTSNVEVAVGEARVLKTFTLAGPHRIVVDLADAKLPGQPLKPSAPGVTRVRFGAPAPGTSRVVVEVERAAQQAKARVVGGKLIISFAS